MTRSTYNTPFIQLNLGKRQTAASSLHKELKANQICLLQEPVVRRGSIGNVPKTHKQFVPFTKDRPRAAALLPKDLGKQTMVLAGLSSGDNITLRSKISKELSIIMASIYMDNTKDIPSDLITRIASYSEREKLPLIAGVDSNAHHVAWGHGSTNARGRSLLQTLSANNLIICNTGSTPTFVGNLGHSVIDLTICNPLGYNLIKDWKVEKGKSLSDHEAITFNIALGNQVSLATRSPSKCDWHLYQQLIEAEFTRNPFWFKPVSTAADLDARQLFISDILRRSFNAACPITRGTIRSSVPWWTAELTKSKQSAKALRRKANRTRNNQDWVLYREANRMYSKLLKQARRKNWKQFCDNLKGTNSLARIHKILNLDKSSTGSLNSVRKPNGELTSTPEDTLKVISDTLIPDDGTVVEPTPFAGGDIPTILKITSPNRVDRAVRELQLNKASGPDEIRNIMIQKAWDYIKDPVRMIFHHSLSLGITPTEWHSSTGCIIPKPLKEDYTNPRSFRIISLTSSFQKILERLILWHLEIDEKIPAKLTKNQHGFKKGHSTESAIHILSRRIEDAMACGNYSLGVFLDIEQAFDAVSFTAIKDALHQANISDTVSQWIFHMVSNRYITLTFCDTSITKKATRGSPQGGVLSPLIWNLTLNTFLSSLGIHSNFIQAFADDLVILISGICKSTVRNLAQQHLQDISTWCHSKGLKLSRIKTTAVLFTNKRDTTLDRPLTIEGEDIRPANSVLYLGVTFDSKLNWGPHILKKCDKATGQLHACKRAVGKLWGISPQGIKWLYNQVILPSVGYSAFSWQHTVERRLYISTRLEGMQRHAALMITRGLKSSPTPNLEILAGLQPINLRLKQLAIKTALRLKLYKLWNKNYEYEHGGHSKSHAYSVESMLSNIPFSECRITDRIPTTIVLDRRFKVQIHSRIDAIKQVDLFNEHDWQIYTDGSKANENTGAGFCVIHSNREIFRQSYYLGKLATVYQCETFALHMASQWATTNIGTPSNIIFLSDSQAVIRAINGSKITSRMIQDTITQLNSLGTTHKVELRWVPGHEGVPGNERADELAREGSSQRPQGPEPYVPITETILENGISSYLFNLHTRQYNNRSLSDKGKIPILHFLRTYRYSKTQLSGIHFRWLTWLLTGHSPLAYFQHKANNFSSPDCEHCPGTEETSQHFLGECYAYITIRLRIFGKLFLTMDDLPNTNIRNIIKSHFF